MFSLPEPVRMLTGNPRLFDLSSDGPLQFVMRQKFTGFVSIPEKTSLTGKTVLITGATAGVGHAAAKQLVQLGASLVLGARNVAKAQAVRQELLQLSPSASVRVFALDMASIDSVDQFVQGLEDAGIRHLDVAILNAGLFARNLPRAAPDGWSHLMQVNFRSTAYLGLLLVPLLERRGGGGGGGLGAAAAAAAAAAERGGSTTPGRLVLVSSEAHAWSDFQPPPQDRSVLSDFMAGAPDPRPDLEYFAAKLFIALFGRELASRVNPSTVEVVTTTPGFCASNLFPDASSMLTRLIFMTQARSLEQGGRLHVHAATCSDAGLSGKYMRDGRVTSLSPFANSDAGLKVQGSLWNEMVVLVGQRQRALASSIKQ